MKNLDPKSLIIGFLTAIIPTFGIVLAMGSSWATAAMDIRDKTPDAIVPEAKGAGKLKDRVVGTWHTTVDDTYLVFNADGTGTAREGGGKEKDIRWLIRSGDLFVLDTGDDEERVFLELSEDGEKLHLVTMVFKRVTQ